MKVRDFHDEVWWPRCVKRLRDVTLSSYDVCWNNHIKPDLGDMELDEVTPRFLDAWLVDKQIGHGTWKVLKTILKLAYRYEVIERDPCDRVVDTPRRYGPKSDALSYSELMEMLDGISDTRVYANICCSAFLGLRREESCGLEWEDFDWESGTVSITKGLQYVDGRDVVVEPKTRTSWRTLPIPPELRERIYPLRSSGRLCGETNAHQVAYQYRYWCLRRDLPYISMTGLRTTWATIMANCGMPISLISKHMGHADVEITERWYIKPLDADLSPLTVVWGALEAA